MIPTKVVNLYIRIQNISKPSTRRVRISFEKDFIAEGDEFCADDVKSRQHDAHNFIKEIGEESPDIVASLDAWPTIQGFIGGTP